MKYENMSIWEIHIDDLVGELAMVPTEMSAAKMEVVERHDFLAVMDLLENYPRMSPTDFAYHRVKLLEKYTLQPDNVKHSAMSTGER